MEGENGDRVDGGGEDFRIALPDRPGLLPLPDVGHDVAEFARALFDELLIGVQMEQPLHFVVGEQSFDDRVRLQFLEDGVEVFDDRPFGVGVFFERCDGALVELFALAFEDLEVEFLLRVEELVERARRDVHGVGEVGHRRLLQSVAREEFPALVEQFLSNVSSFFVAESFHRTT